MFVNIDCTDCDLEFGLGFPNIDCTDWDLEFGLGSRLVLIVRVRIRVKTACEGKDQGQD